MTYGKRLLDPDFQFEGSAATKAPNYLAEKWDRLYPGWRSKPKPPPSPPRIILPNDIPISSRKKST